MIAVKLFRKKIKRINSLDDLKEVRVNDAVEIPKVEAKGIVHYIDSTRNPHEFVQLIQRVNRELRCFMYEFNVDGDGISSLSYKKGILCPDEDVKKYEPKLRRAGL